MTEPRITRINTDPEKIRENLWEFVKSVVKKEK
jgi:hypothetical protein